MRIIKLILFTITLALVCSVSYGQAPTKVAFGGTRPIDTAWAGRHLRIDSTVRFLKYSTSDATKYLRINASGFLELGTPAGGGGNADSATFFTNYRADTMRSNIYTQLGLKGTVTNVSTGFGMLGGPITTAGTVRADSNYLMTVARGYKVADSVAGLIPSVSGYQLYTDTNTFDATKANLNSSLAGKQNYTDTSTWDATRSWVTGQIPSVSGYVPYTGATDSVRLGEYPIRAGQFRFDLTPTAPTVIGGMYWDTANVTVSIPLNADVTLQVGQETVVRARNNTGSIISNGSAVYISGAQGNNPTIALANADSATTSYVVGVATEDIGINSTGFVTVTGVVNGVNTSSFTAGDRLYLSTTNGQITNAIPPAPHMIVGIGVALNSTNNGRIFVRPSTPIATDTALLNGTTVAPTQYAVRRYVINSLSGKMNYTDTVALSNRINTKQSYSDTSTWDATRSWVTGQGFGTGTVTSVGSGFGLSGGAITTTGTLRVDTTNVPTQYRVDTTAFNALTRINTKGTVSSVALANGFGLSISGSPVTGTGTITATVDTTTVIATTSDINTAVATKVNYTDTVALSNRISLLNTVQGANVASADTINLLTTTGNYVNVTGTTQIYRLSPASSANSALIGARRVVQFTGALTLTYNATTLILPGSVNRTTVAGDMAEFVYEGGVAWRCITYVPRTVTGTGSTVLAASPTFTGTAVAAAFSVTGTVTATGTLTLTGGTGNTTSGFATGVTTSGNTKAVNVGTAGAAGSTTNITLGSSVTGAGGTTQVNGLFVAGTQTYTTTGTNVNAVSITPTYNQASGAAANTDLLINRTQTAVGSGTQRLISGQVAGVEKWGVDTAGRITTSGGLTSTGTMSVTGTATFTSTVTATTAAASDSTTNVATTAFVNSRIQTITTTNFTTSYTINSGNKYNVQLNITAQAGALLFNNPTGTWVNNQMILGSVQDNGTNRAITWDTKWVGANGSTLPSTTTTGRPLIWVALYNSFQDKYYVSLL